MDFLTKYKKIFIISMIVLCLCAILVTATYTGTPAFLQNALGFVLTPVQDAVSKAGYWARERIDFLRSMDTLEAELIRLREENAVLRADNTRLTLAQDENEQYAEYFELDQIYGAYPKTGARIIARNIDDWFDVYVINKGAKHDLRKEMIVLAPGGLMGMIIECSNDYSIVISLIDDRAADIAAKSARSDSLGIVEGDISLMQQGLCKMSLIDINAQIAVGDEIVTSPLSVKYPAGIVIGTVKEIVPDPNGLTKHAIIQPAVSLGQVETVLVVTDFTPNERG